MEWFTNSLRSFFASLDIVVYSLMSTLYQLFLDLSNIDILSNEAVSKFYTKIYVLLGLFMLVKVSFSFINYIVNPDMFLDKQKGVQKIFVNVIVSLVMLTVAPFAFSMLAKVQNAILDDNIIPMFFLGQDSDDVTNHEFYISDFCEKTNATKATASNQADYLALLSFRPFYQPNTDKFGNFDDPDGPSMTPIYCASYENATVTTYLHDSIYNASDTSSWYNKQHNGNFNSSEKYYLVDYQLVLSTATGVFICLLLISFCFDIAVRSIKLGFLELIAPVPIVSYIDPKSGKDGMFSKWIKEVGKTWLDLFIRLSAVFLAIFIINLVASNEIDYGDAKSSHFWIMLFIILGALIFAKKLPDLIQSVFGFKLAGSIQLNPFKKIQNEALFGKQIVGAAGAVAAGGLGLATGAAVHGLAVANKLKNVNAAKTKLKGAQAELSSVRAPRDAIQTQINAKNAAIDKIHARKQDLTQQWIMSNSASEKARLSRQIAKADQGLNRVETEKDKLIADRAVENQKVAAEAVKVRDAREKLKSEKEPVEGKKSNLYHHPISGAVTEAATSAIDAMKRGYKDPAHFFKNASSGRQAGINHRSYYEQFSFGDKVRDKYTDVVGIKNDTGTTSETKKAIKDRQDSLIRIEDYIKMLNKNLTDIAGKDFHNAVTVNDKGIYEFNSSYTGSNARDIQAVVSEYSRVMDQKFAIEKEIKKLQGIQDTGKDFIKPPSSK